MGFSRSTSRALGKVKLSGCPLVLIEWVDSCYSPGWQFDDDEPSVKECLSVGWLRRKTEQAVVLTANITMEENPHRCCEITIPTCSIRRIHKL